MIKKIVIVIAVLVIASLITTIPVSIVKEYNCCKRCEPLQGSWQPPGGCYCHLLKLRPTK